MLRDIISTYLPQCSANSYWIDSQRNKWNFCFLYFHCFSLSVRILVLSNLNRDLEISQWKYLNCPPVSRVEFLTSGITVVIVLSVARMAFNHKSQEYYHNHGSSLPSSLYWLTSYPYLKSGFKTTVLKYFKKYPRSWGDGSQACRPEFEAPEPI